MKKQSIRKRPQPVSSPNAVLSVCILVRSLSLALALRTFLTLLSSVGLRWVILYLEPRRIDRRWKRPENLGDGSSAELVD